MIATTLTSPLLAAARVTRRPIRPNLRREKKIKSVLQVIHIYANSYYHTIPGGGSSHVTQADTPTPKNESCTQGSMDGSAKESKFIRKESTCIRKNTRQKTKGLVRCSGEKYLVINFL